MERVAVVNETKSEKTTPNLVDLSILETRDMKKNDYPAGTILKSVIMRGLKKGEPILQRRQPSGRWVNLCLHGKRQDRCRDCEGASFCTHGKDKYQCKQCKGSAFCVHNRFKSTCKDCGGWSICEHNRMRTVCRQCRGGTICEHGKRRSRCYECGGNDVCRVEGCKKQKNNGDYCIACHPDYIETFHGVSKVACEFFCRLEHEEGVKIQHSCYNTQGGLVRDEYQAPCIPKGRVDGRVTKGSTTIEEGALIEFHGNVWHGHPSRWHLDGKSTSHFHQDHKERYYRTEKKMNTLAEAGYDVYYVWEEDYRPYNGGKKALQKVSSVLRRWDGELKPRPRRGGDSC